MKINQLDIYQFLTINKQATLIKKLLIFCFKQAKVNTEKLEFLLRDTTRQRQRDVEQAADSTASLLKETQEKMEIMKQDLTDERNQSAKYRDLLTQVKNI